MSCGNGQIPINFSKRLVQRETIQVPSVIMDTLTPPILALVFPFLDNFVRISAATVRG